MPLRFFLSLCDQRFFETVRYVNPLVIVTSSLAVQVTPLAIVTTLLSFLVLIIAEVLYDPSTICVCETWNVLFLRPTSRVLYTGRGRANLKP